MRDLFLHTTYMEQCPLYDFQIFIYYLLEHDLQCVWMSSSHALLIPVTYSPYTICPPPYLLL